MFEYETEAKDKGYQRVAGVDEVGRGPLAGPVVAAAVILPPLTRIPGLDDSKKLSPATRERLFPQIQQAACDFGLGIVPEDVIDRINILQASRLAMKKAVEQLQDPPDLILVDGNHAIETGIDQRTIVGGDRLSHSIAAASVLAKVTRDRLMEDYNREYPQYGFDRHKGYGTELHRERIERFGPCAIHRRTFKGVKEHCRE